MANNHDNNKSHPVTKKEYLDKLYDIKNASLPPCVGRAGVGMSFDIKELLINQQNFIVNLQNYIKDIEAYSFFM